jgi:hypothetical protein
MKSSTLSRESLPNLTQVLSWTRCFCHSLVVKVLARSRGLPCSQGHLLSGALVILLHPAPTVKSALNSVSDRCTLAGGCAPAHLLRFVVYSLWFRQSNQTIGLFEYSYWKVSLEAFSEQINRQKKRSMPVQGFDLHELPRSRIPFRATGLWY